MFEYRGVTISWLGHSSFRITDGKKDGKTVYIDPYGIKQGAPANIILITHDHFDHCSMDDVRKLTSANTTILTTGTVKEKLRGLVGRFLVMEPNSAVDVGDMKIEAVPAYNVNKFRSPGVAYHPDASRMIGFIMTINGVRIYHAGDTDAYPGIEKKVKDIDIAILPISGTYVMTPDEAAEAAARIKPKVLIPMHYGTIIGGKEDVERLKMKAVGRQIVVLAKE